MKQGDFTKVAKFYSNRPGYSHLILDQILTSIGLPRDTMRIADIAAGTGKLTSDLLELGIKNIIPVEPNDNMRAEGQKAIPKLNWLKGAGENTGLDSDSFDLVTVGSAFHWFNLEHGLKELSRILRSGGKLSVMWNPRDLERDSLQKEIDDKIKKYIPTLERKSSGAKHYTGTLFDDLESFGTFKDTIFSEARHSIKMSRERYIGVWKSVNDIQSQAGEETWERIITYIEATTKDMEYVEVFYKTRSWTTTKV